MVPEELEGLATFFQQSCKHLKKSRLHFKQVKFWKEKIRVCGKIFINCLPVHKLHQWFSPSFYDRLHLAQVILKPEGGVYIFLFCIFWQKYELLLGYGKNIFLKGGGEYESQN